MEKLSEKAAQNLAAVRNEKPLIHNITNAVVMSFTANALLAMGASPVMAFSREEVAEMVTLAKALVLNIGTPTRESIASMIEAGEKASQLGLPIVLDPVGAGATSMRKDLAKALIEKLPVCSIRGNPSEILSLGSSRSEIEGIYTVHTVEQAIETGIALAKDIGTTIAITGQSDFITDGERTIRVSNGHALMAYVTGIGCAASAAIGAFSAVDRDPFTATVSALAFTGLAGEFAGKKATAPGSFMVEIINAMYAITPKDLGNGCKIV
jgi:hydroxyethylthiazole kinase